MSQMRTLIAASLLLAPGGAASYPSALSGDGLVMICHHAGPKKQFEIFVDDSAVPHHILQHGDTVGECGGEGDPG